MTMISTSSFFFNDTATTEIYTLSLHDALPISRKSEGGTRNNADCSAFPLPRSAFRVWGGVDAQHRSEAKRDRKSTRLNSSHTVISYAVFCLKKKKKKRQKKKKYELLYYKTYWI